MSIAILTIGVTGVIAMQKVTVTSNQHAKNLAIATQIGQAWMDQLRADALSWNHPSARLATSDLAQTTWLQSVPNTGTSAWFQPAWDANRNFGAGFDVQGRPAAPDSTAPRRFCTHLRLSWLYQANGTMAGNGLIRAEVRVFWLREGQSGIQNRLVCSNNENPADIGAATERYHFVYNVSAIRQNTLF
jgi:Tfp pilus assembly protein PilV